MRQNKFSYEDYKQYLREKGWKGRTVILDQDNKDNLIGKINIYYPDKSLIVVIELPYNTKITTHKECPNHKFGLYLTDENGKEIPDDTIIYIAKNVPSVAYARLLRVKYSDIKMFNYEPLCNMANYEFSNYELSYNELLQIEVINSKIYIPKENIKFKIICDYWTKT